jgi:tetratricopeptide (TPR) repeat protein
VKRAALLLVCLATAAGAQPKDPDKGNAKALLQSGLKLYAAKDYLGALAVFKDAYARFPSGKILLNIGTTLVKLDRPAEAANAYQGYLDSPDVDPAKQGEATRVLAELDKRVGLLDIAITPGDAELEINGDGWRAASAVKRTRVSPGEITVRARRDTYKPLTRSVTARAGATETLAITLELEPVAVSNPAGTPAPGLAVTARHEPAATSRLGGIALAHVDPANGGAAAIVGAEVSVTGRIDVRAAAILGPYVGGYVGGSVALLTGRVRPIVAVAMPMFRSDGMRFAVRGAGGVELVVNRHLAVIAELGVEHLLNPQDSVTSKTLVVPALGVGGRL